MVSASVGRHRGRTLTRLVFLAFGFWVATIVFGQLSLNIMAWKPALASAVFFQWVSFRWFNTWALVFALGWIGVRGELRGVRRWWMPTVVMLHLASEETWGLFRTLLAVLGNPIPALEDLAVLWFCFLAFKNLGLAMLCLALPLSDESVRALRWTRRDAAVVLLAIAMAGLFLASILLLAPPRTWAMLGCVQMPFQLPLWLLLLSRVRRAAPIVAVAAASEGHDRPADVRNT